MRRRCSHRPRSRPGSNPWIFQPPRSRRPQWHPSLSLVDRARSPARGGDVGGRHVVPICLAAPICYIELRGYHARWNVWLTACPHARRSRKEGVRDCIRRWGGESYLRLRRRQSSDLRGSDRHIGITRCPPQVRTSPRACPETDPVDHLSLGYRRPCRGASDIHNGGRHQWVRLHEHRVPHLDVVIQIEAARQPCRGFRNRNIKPPWDVGSRPDARHSANPIRPIGISLLYCVPRGRVGGGFRENHDCVRSQ